MYIYIYLCIAYFDSKKTHVYTSHSLINTLTPHIASFCFDGYCGTAQGSLEFFDGYSATAHGLLYWFAVDLRARHASLFRVIAYCLFHPKKKLSYTSDSVI